MKITEDSLKFGKMQLVTAAGIAASIVLWAFFLNSTGITVNDLFTFKFHILAEKVLATNFLLFLIAFPLPTVVMAALAKKMDKLNLFIVSLIATLAGIIIAMAAFPQLQSLWIVAVFYAISVPLAIEKSYMCYAELKSWITMRTMAAATGKAVTLVSIGLFVLSVATILPEHEEYIEKFETFMVDFSQGLLSGESGQSIVSSTTDLFVERDRKWIEKFMQNPAFRKLREKTDPDVVLFVASADAMKDQINSPHYRQEVEKQISQATGTMKKLGIMKAIKKEMPIFVIMEQLLWVIHALFLAGTFSLMATIICKTMSVVYGIPASKAAELTGKEEKIKN